MNRDMSPKSISHLGQRKPRAGAKGKPRYIGQIDHPLSRAKPIGHLKRMQTSRAEHGGERVAIYIMCLCTVQQLRGKS